MSTDEGVCIRCGRWLDTPSNHLCRSCQVADEEKKRERGRREALTGGRK